MELQGEATGSREAPGSGRFAAARGRDGDEFALFFSMVPVGLALADREHRLLRVNPTLTALTGLRAGQSVFEALGPELGGKSVEARERVLEHGAEVRVDVAGALDGRQRVFANHYFPVVVDGATVGVGTVVTDVTLERAQQRRLELSAAVGVAFEAAADEAGVVDAVAAIAVPALADDCRVEDAAGPLAPVVEPHGLRLALVAGGRRLGALVLQREAARPAFGEDDAALAADLAERTALRLDAARLEAERAHVALTLQHALLPPAPPAIPGAQVALRHRAAVGEVGGDVLDAFPAGAATWFVAVGDVSGKGPEAAAVTSLARHTLRAGVDVDPRPGAALALLNRRLLGEEGAVGRFVTMACALVRRTGAGLRLQVAVAGHLPPLVRTADGTVTPVAARGRLLGVQEELDLEEAVVVLGPGDVLLLHTDGVTETAPGPGQLGEAGLRALLAEAPAGAGAVADHVLAGALAAAGGELRDDAALLALAVPAAG